MVGGGGPLGSDPIAVQYCKNSNTLIRIRRIMRLIPYPPLMKYRNVEAEGLEWETPDRFRAEIAELGYDAWLDQFQSPAERRRRVACMNDCLEELAPLCRMTLAP
jgi:hypothetical protein